MCVSAVLFAALTSMSEIAGLYSQRPIVERHRNAALYHPCIEALALTLVDIPITLVIMIGFVTILYFMVGLQRSAVRDRQDIIYISFSSFAYNAQGQFMFVYSVFEGCLARANRVFRIFFLAIFCISTVVKSLFRALAAAFKSEATALSVAGLSLPTMTIYTGKSPLQ